MGEMVERVDEQDRTLGVVDRGEAIRRRWLHRVATTVCRDPDGRFLVHRRPDHLVPPIMLTEARAKTPWLREGTSVPQQQTVRDFAKSRSRALKDIERRLPMRQPAGMPRHKKKREALPTLNYTTRGFRLKGGRLYL
ncbi:hypothetical protein ACFVYV_48275, partial [Streptomyces mirabilis]